MAAALDHESKLLLRMAMAFHRAIGNHHHVAMDSRSSNAQKSQTQPYLEHEAVYLTASDAEKKKPFQPTLGV